MCSTAFVAMRQCLSGRSCRYEEILIYHPDRAGAAPAHTTKAWAGRGGGDRGGIVVSQPAAMHGRSLDSFQAQERSSAVSVQGQGKSIIIDRIFCRCR